MLEIENDGIIRELEAYGLTPQESLIVCTLLNSTKALTSKKIAELLGIPRYQIYNIISKLENQKIIKQVSMRPKKLISDPIILKESFLFLEQRILNECNTFENLSPTSLSTCYQMLSFDDDQKIVHEYLVKTSATRNDLIKALKFNYDKIRNITDFLSSHDYIKKRMQGKAILYIGVPVGEIIQSQIDFLRKKVEEKRQRVQRILLMLESRTLKDDDEADQPITQIISNYEQIQQYTIVKSQNAQEVLNSLFNSTIQNFIQWKEIIKKELVNAIELCNTCTSVKWLVDRSFLSIFKNFDAELIEKVMKASPKFSIRVTSRWTPPVLIIDELEVIEYSSFAPFMEKALYLKDEEIAKVKKFDFLSSWEIAHDFRPLIGDIIEKQKLIYFTGRNIEFKILKTFDIALLGDKGVGKTTLTQRYIHSKFDPDIRYTLGILVNEAIVKVRRSSLDLDQIKLIIYDFAGQALFRESYDSQLKDKSGFGLVFSLNDQKTLENLESWIELIGTENYEDKMIFLIGTKSDLSIVIDYDTIWDFRKKYRIEHYFETSSITGKNVQRVFEEFVEQLNLINYS
ncbi:MAG: helix-turn-helix domain-containing protein [Candidatus Hodarchaeales archaeon]